MKKRLYAGSVVLVLVAGFLLWFKWKQDEPRRYCLEALHHLDESLRSNSPQQLLASVAMPQALQARTAAEQVEFISKALRDELSSEGLEALRRKGTFGPLKHLFPQEAEIWAKQAGVNPDDCLAFKLERNSLRAEVVLARNLDSGTRSAEPAFKVVRVNNVKQMATDL